MKTKTLALGAITVAIAAWATHTLYLAGSFKTIQPHFAGSCRPVSGVIGAEDISIHPSKPVAYLSAYDRRSGFQGLSATGGLYRYALDRPDAQPEPLNHAPLTDFQPHGISLFVAPDGAETLFVVNHAHGEHSIEVFSVDGADLRHRQTLRDPLLVSPNDIHAVTANQFYVTNDHGSGSRTLHTIEDYLRLPLAGVVHFDSQNFSSAAEGLRYANGINQSQDGLTLYVASITLPGLYIYDRNPTSNALSLRQTLSVHAGLDNIERDEDGALWIAAHPKLLDFVAHAKDAQQPSPSQVFKIVPAADGGYEVQEVYLNDGRELSGSSVAAKRGERLLIGPVFEPHFLDCSLN